MLTKRKLCFFSFLYSLLFLSLALSLLALPVSGVTKTPSQETAPNLEQVTSSVSGGKNFLLLGIDEVSGSSDVIMLSHVDFDKKEIKLLQIPRDSYTATHGKINSIFASAYLKALKEGQSRKKSLALGADAISQHLSGMLGVTVDHHVVLTLSDFRTLVDDLGGVPITLPQALDYDDPAQGLSIHLEAGRQTLDGKAAEGLVRCRNAYPNADYGRMDAQKLFMTAFFKKLKNDTSPFKLFSFVRNALRFVCTDISLSECISMGRVMLSAKSDTLLFATLAGSTLKIDSLLYEVLPEENLEKASLWLGGSFSEESAQNACVGKNKKALAIYLAPAESPFSPHSSKED